MSWYFSFGFLPFPSLPSPERHITVFFSAFIAKYPIRNAATEKRTTKRTTMKTSRRRVDRLLTPEISSSILALLTFKLRSLNFLIRSNALRNIFLSSKTQPRIFVTDLSNEMSAQYYNFNWSFKVFKCYEANSVLCVGNFQQLSNFMSLSRSSNL